MPPRSYYAEPRVDDYIAYARNFFPEEIDNSIIFSDKTKLPYINSTNHLAAYIGVSASLIRQILYNTNYHYREFEIPKKNGDSRSISTPRTYLKVIHWWILDNILSTVDLPDCVHGFRAERSYLTNARYHFGANHILNVDIEHFFDSISISCVKKVFEEFGYSGEGSEVLSQITTKNGCIPTGAPTSPSIANFTFSAVDRELINLAQENGFKYSRYADDLTFSSAARIDVNFVGKIRHIVGRHGFKLNERKTKFMGRGDRQEVTGVIINDRPNSTKEWRNWARGYINRVEKTPEQFISELNRLNGVFGILRQFDPDIENKLTIKASVALEKLRALGQ